MFAKIENNQIIKYPVMEREIRLEFPNVSFPLDISNFLPNNYVKVLLASKPNDTEYLTYYEDLPIFENGMWKQNWISKNKFNEEELVNYEQNKIEQKWQVFRSERDCKISIDLWILQRHRDQKELNISTTITEEKYNEWLNYIQQLRDLPNTITDINNVVWPTPPQ